MSFEEKGKKRKEESEREATPVEGADVEMADESEPEPELEPAKRTTKSRAGKNPNGVAPSPKSIKKPTPVSQKKAVTPAKAVRGKPKVDSDSTTLSSPVVNTNGAVRRSARSRG